MTAQTVTRAQLSEAVYQEVGLSRNESADLVETVLREISDTLTRGEPVKISSFGSFSVRQKGQRVGRNPKTGQEVPILPRKVLVFRASNVLKARINNALANDTPIAVAYVDEGGRPHLSLRGSTQVYSDTQLSIWARSSTTGIAAAIDKNPNVELLYRDNGSRSTLVMTGKARVETSDAIRRKIFEGSPEVEQNHESWESGAAIIIDLTTVNGATPDGRVRMKVS